MKKHFSFFIFLVFIVNSSSAQISLNNTKIDGYRGIWFTLGQFSEYGDKYSGGLGTYTAKHRPLAIYAHEVKKTFFVYGGTTDKDSKHLLCMISYYDHKKKVVPKPTVVFDKQIVNDPHDNPSLAIDSEGYLWVFVSGRGRTRPGFKYRSDQPYDINSFTQITEEEMTYPQPLYDGEQGFFHFFTKYTGVRELYYETSSNGYTWTNDKKLAGILEEGATKSGHYQVSGNNEEFICTFFNRHPNGNVDKRTDLYYAQTKDFGETWTTIKGDTLDIPLIAVDCGARIVDYSPLKKNVYMKDLAFDKNGYPICLYLTSGGHEPGPQNSPREWRVTFYNGNAWETSIICKSDHNYDMGSLYIKNNKWRLIAPTEDGPQKHQAGGEVAIWQSKDGGKTWEFKKMITHGSKFNHNYIRRPINGKNTFFFLWADGDPTGFSKSFLYFSDSKGKHIYRLPYEMEENFERPTRIYNHD